jgi:hypothetical protein
LCVFRELLSSSQIIKSRLVQAHPKAGCWYTHSKGCSLFNPFIHVCIDI